MFTLDQVVPWGRNFDEYRRMFALDGASLESDTLDCAAGPSSFNTEATARGMRVISTDPLYRFSAGEVRDRIDASFDRVMQETRHNASQFVWDTMATVEALGVVRMAAMKAFLDDYEPGHAAGRYVAAQLPSLPFPDQSFNLALCSHFLFLYSDQFSGEFHQRALDELCRVAAEVRIFPLLTLAARRSPHLEATVTALAASGIEASIERVPYEFQRGGNEMLRLTRLG